MEYLYIYLFIDLIKIHQTSLYIKQFERGIKKQSW